MKFLCLHPASLYTMGRPLSSLTPFLFFISPIQGLSQALMREISFHFPGQAQANNTSSRATREQKASSVRRARRTCWKSHEMLSQVWLGNRPVCPAQPNANLLTNGNYRHRLSHLTLHGCQNEFGQRSFQLSNNRLCEFVKESFNHLLSESAELSHTRFLHFLTNEFP